MGRKRKQPVHARHIRNGNQTCTIRSLAALTLPLFLPCFSLSPSGTNCTRCLMSSMIDYRWSEGNSYHKCSLWYGETYFFILQPQVGQTFCPPHLDRSLGGRAFPPVPIDTPPHTPIPAVIVLIVIGERRGHDADNLINETPGYSCMLLGVILNT